MKLIELPVNYNLISIAERKAVREAYVENQGGLCAFCKVNLADKPPEHVTVKQIDWSKFPHNFLRHPIHLHHDHDPGMTEGAVHAYCNAVLWQYHYK